MLVDRLKSMRAVGRGRREQQLAVGRVRRDARGRVAEQDPQAVVLLAPRDQPVLGAAVPEHHLAHGVAVGLGVRLEPGRQDPGRVGGIAGRAAVGTQDRRVRVPGPHNGHAVAVGHLGDRVPEARRQPVLVQRSERVRPLGQDRVPDSESLVSGQRDGGTATVAGPLPGYVVEALRRCRQPVDRGDRQPPARVPQPGLPRVAPGLPLAQEVTHPRIVAPLVARQASGRRRTASRSSRPWP